LGSQEKEQEPGHSGVQKIAGKIKDLPLDALAACDDIPAVPAFFAGSGCALLRKLLAALTPLSPIE